MAKINLARSLSGRRKRERGKKKEIEREREGEFFSIYVWYKPTVPRARPDPFDSRGDQWRTKVTHMQAAHRSWLVSDPHGYLPATHKTRP